MKEKTSFIIHKDSLNMLDHLNDEQAGKLFKAIRAYQNGEDISLDAMLTLAFSPFQTQFDRDLEKYLKTCKRNASNGAKGGRPTKPKKPTGFIDNPTKPKKADSDSDSDSEKPKKKTKRKKNVPPATPLDLELANYLAEKIKEHSPKARVSLSRWPDTFRLMREKDERTEQEIRSVVDFATNDNFWKANILSADKLREKFDTLSIKAASTVTATNSRQVMTTSFTSDGLAF